jgi:hypothetical protein
MQQKFEVILDEVEPSVPWTEEQLKKALIAMMDGEKITVKERK